MSGTTYVPSEAAIEAAIERQIGNAGFFQRVAEQVAHAIYPELRRGHIPAPYGRKSNYKTRKGWPDAYLEKVDGSLIAIEATTDQDPKGTHWYDDLRKLKTRLGPKRRGGLVLVIWRPASRPTEGTEIRDRTCRLGVPPEDVHIIFQQDLCARLRTPFHARFWINDLALQATSNPFSRIEQVIQRAATYRRSPGIFPTLEDYREGRVHVPSVLEKVETALLDQRGALVVGHGAAGKSTLAGILAHRPRFRSAPTYVLDLANTSGDPTLAERASEALTAVADRGVLFVIDNAHLNMGVAVRIFEQWRILVAQPNLLILTRRIRASRDVSDDSPEIEALPLPSFNLVITPADLEGVYRRHHRRLNNGDAPDVSPAILAKWLKLFGGSLVLFSAAVLGLLESGSNVAALGAVHARSYVRKHYLDDDVLKPEWAALLDLAAVAEVEGVIPVDAFASDALQACIGRGVVWVEVRGRRGSVYRLAHPGLGTLLREAAGCAATSRNDRRRVLLAHPHDCVGVALWLRKNGEIEEARSLFEELWRKADWPLAGVGLPAWESALTVSLEMALLTHGDVVARAGVWLTRGDAEAAVTEQARITPLKLLGSFLAYAHRVVPDIADAICERLAAKKGAALVERALATGLGDLAWFLDCAAEARKPALVKIVGDGLAANPEGLIKCAFATPLHYIPAFYNTARLQMPVVAQLLREGLGTDVARLHKWALAHPLADIASFLALCRKRMPEVGQRLRASLLSDVPGLVDRAIRDGPQNMTALFKHDAAFTQILPGIDIEAWSRQTANANYAKPSWFLAFASFCYNSPAEVLVPPVAEAIIRRAPLVPDLGIRQVVSFVAAFHECTAEEVDAFFKRSLPADWVVGQYRSPDALLGTLAAGVRRIALDERAWLGHHFRRPALRQRIETDEPSEGSSPQTTSEWLQLFGAARLLERSTIGLRSVNLPSLHETLECAPPGSPEEGIQAIQAGLWCGLREWCHVTGRSMTVDAALGDGILAQFRVAQPSGRRYLALNAVMIDWLERSRKQDWQLVADQTSILDALEARLQG